MRIGKGLMEVLESIQKPFDPQTSEAWPAASFAQNSVEKLEKEGLVETFYYCGGSAYEAVQITEKGKAEYGRRAAV